jgi:hypothetical protein
MEALWRYRGRVLSAEDLAFIRALIAAHPEASRRALSRALCQAWGWVQENGALRDMLCRSLMLGLHRAGLITLPPIRFRTRNNVIERRRPAARAADCGPLRTSLAELQPITLRQVRRTAEEGLLQALLDQHHYLGYTQPVGEHLKYLVCAQGRPIACLAWSSAPRHLGARDRFIGWSPEARRRNLRYLAYNSRFLILPWVDVPHLASHLLGQMARTLPGDWERFYGHTLYYLESFIDPARFRGTCYRAANWQFLGRTTGRGKADSSHRPNRPCKEVLGLALTRRFRELLCAGSPSAWRSTWASSRRSSSGRVRARCPRRTTTSSRQCSRPWPI